MSPTDEQIKEIVELLDCGQLCFFHKTTGSIEHYADPYGPYFDPEPWQDAIDKVEADRSNYQEFEKMGSNEAFQVMKDFANSLPDEEFNNQLFKLLSQNKPFSKFKWAIDNSEYRQDWFDFKGQASINWVLGQLAT